MKNIELSNPEELQIIREKLQGIHEEVEDFEGLEATLISGILCTLLGAAYTSPMSLMKISALLKEFVREEIENIQASSN